jgi:predicted  nucleic acid-binding Zn-ribbon protein
MSHSLSLYRLQQIDSGIDRARARMDAVNRKLEDDDEVRIASEHARSTEITHQAAQHKLNEAEVELDDHRIKIEQIESSLYSGAVRNPKELQDLENDLDALKRHLGTLEDRLLDAMQAAEETDASRLDATIKLNSLQTQSNIQNHDLQEEGETIQKEIDRLMTEKAAVLETMPQDIVDLYNKLRQERGGIAVSQVSDDACSACGSTLTPAQIQSSRIGDQIAYCNSCGRILYGS